MKTYDVLRERYPEKPRSELLEMATGADLAHELGLCHDLEAKCPVCEAGDRTPRVKGADVTVWTDPITREVPEGTARLVSWIATDDETGLETWLVRFLEDGRGAAPHLRRVHRI